MSPPLVLPYAEEIRRLRDAKGWSQENLAAEAGCSKPTITRLEKGTHPSRPSTITQVAKALGVEPTHLLRSAAVRHTTVSGCQMHPSIEKLDTLLSEVGTAAKRATGQDTLKSLLNTLRFSQPSQEQLATTLALALQLAFKQGHGDPDVKEALERVYALLKEKETQFKVIHALALSCLMHGERQAAHTLTQEGLRLAKALDMPSYRIDAWVNEGIMWCFDGDFVQSRNCLIGVLATHDERDFRRFAEHFSDNMVVAYCYLMFIQHPLGWLDQARDAGTKAWKRAEKVADIRSMSMAHFFTVGWYQMNGDPQGAVQEAQKAVELAQWPGMEMWEAGGKIQQGWALAMLGEVERGLTSLHEGLEMWRQAVRWLALPRWLTLLAEAYAKAGHPARGQEALREAYTIVQRFEDRHYEAEIHRVRGELLIQTSPRDTAPAETCFHTALEIARRQQAKFFELRAAISLSRLWQGQGKRLEAQQLLGSIYTWFTEGLETPVLQEAERLRGTLI
jgi:transcriptional regulator with XRE-family HTH domain